MAIPCIPEEVQRWRKEADLHLQLRVVSLTPDGNEWRWRCQCVVLSVFRGTVGLGDAVDVRLTLFRHSAPPGHYDSSFEDVGPGTVFEAYLSPVVTGLGFSPVPHCFEAMDGPTDEPLMVEDMGASE